MRSSQHVCPQCFKAFTRATILRDHQRAHSGIKPFQCGNCDRAFTRAWDLHSHEQTHRQCASYECGGCGAGFKRKRDVLRHQKRKKGSRCRTERSVSTQIDGEFDTAVTLTGLGHDVVQDHGVHDEDASKERTQQLPCPLTMPPNLWLAELLEPELSKRSFMQDLVCLFAWPSLASLRTHLRRSHNMHLPCQDCNTFLHAKPMDNCFSFPGLICHNADCAPETESGRFKSHGHLHKVAMPAVGGNPSTIEWFRVLHRSSPVPMSLRGGSNGASCESTTLDLGDSDISANHATINQRPSMPKILPYPQQSYTVYETLAANAAISSYQESRAATPRITPNPDEVPVMYDPPSLSAIVQNARHDALTLLYSTTTDSSPLHGDVDSSSYDATPDSPPDLLKVIVDVTKYLQERPPGKVSLGLKYCQWEVLGLLVARLDEVPKAYAGVTLAHTDALWRAYDKHRNARVSSHFGVLNKAFDQLMRPLLTWRRPEPMTRATLEWAADFKSSIMRLGCRREICPCEKYLKKLKPQGDRVTAIRHHYQGHYVGQLEFRMGDQIKLISREEPFLWKGQSIRTGQIGVFHQEDCA